MKKEIIGYIASYQSIKNIILYLFPWNKDFWLNFGYMRFTKKKLLKSDKKVKITIEEIK